MTVWGSFMWKRRERLEQFVSLFHLNLFSFFSPPTPPSVADTGTSPNSKQSSTKQVIMASRAADKRKSAQFDSFFFFFLSQRAPQSLFHGSVRDWPGHLLIVSVSRASLVRRTGATRGGKEADCAGAANGRLISAVHIR